MTRTPVLRGAAVAAALLAAVPVLSACGAGRSNETEHSVTTITPRNAAIGDVRVRAAYVAPDSSGGSKGYVVATFVNAGGTPDTLTGVSADGGGVSGGSSVQLLPRQPVSFVDPTTGMSGQQVELTPSSGSLDVGTSVAVTFAFQNAGSLTMKLPVEATHGTTSVETPAPTGESATTTP